MLRVSGVSWVLVMTVITLNTGHCMMSAVQPQSLQLNSSSALIGDSMRISSPLGGRLETVVLIDVNYVLQRMQCFMLL